MRPKLATVLQVRQTPPPWGMGVGEVAAVCHVAEPRSRQFWTSSHSAFPRVRHATGQHIQLRITFRQLRLRDQPIVYSSSWKAPPLRPTILTELGGPECEVDHISEVTNVTARPDRWMRSFSGGVFVQEESIPEETRPRKRRLGRMRIAMPSKLKPCPDWRPLSHFRDDSVGTDCRVGMAQEQFDGRT
jgi:hypothetical protein